MEIFFISAFIVCMSLLWFWAVMKIAKRTVGKQASTSQIFGFLLISGPVGWIVLIIIFVTDIIENSNFLKK